MNAPRPNFLWISLEDCSPRFGCYGDSVARTPNIDRLAAEGTVFPNTFCTAPVCSPSRTTVITGFPATAMAAHHMRTTFVSEEYPELPTPYRAVPPPFVKCFTESLRAAGYYCSNNGKTDYQFQAPFSAWDANGRPATVDQIHWRNRPDASQPFFAVFNLEDTHESRMWPNRSPMLETDSRPHPPTDPKVVVVPPYLPDTPAVRQTIARHYDNIAHNDAVVGKLLAQLEEDGLARDTVVMLWSDHGEGLPRAKRFLYDSGTRVPLIVRWPGHLAGGAVDERMVSLIDLAPTVLEAAGIPRPCHLGGLSIFGTASQPYVFAHRDRLDGEYDKSRSVRSRRYKYIRNYYPGRERFGYMPYRSDHEAMQAIRYEQIMGNQRFDQPCPPEELYDLESDPHEMENQIDSPELAGVRAELNIALDEWQSRNDLDNQSAESEIVSRIWPGGSEPRTAVPFATVYHSAAMQGNLIEETCEARGPVLLQLSCGTEGASIGYQFQGSSTWLPYQQIIRLEAGVHSLALRAIRYGYAESETRTIRITIPS